MLKNQQIEMFNDILFVFLLLLFFVLGLPIHRYVGMSVYTYATFFLLFFSGIIYGYISKNPPKSFLIGFLFLPTVGIFSIIEQLFTAPFLPHIQDFIFAFIVSIFLGLPGYFTAKFAIQINTGTKDIDSIKYLLLFFFTYIIMIIVLFFLFLD